MTLQVILSVLVLVLWVVLLGLIRRSFSRYQERKQFSEARFRFAVRIVNAFLLFAVLLVVLAVWGVDVRNVGIFLSSILGLVAIGFFAVWSILSNIVAGVFIYMSDAFRLQDEIVILPEDIRGRVTDLKLMFVVLEDEEGNTLHIPNNLLIQKVIKRLRPQAGA